MLFKFVSRTFASHIQVCGYEKEVGTTNGIVYYVRNVNATQLDDVTTPSLILCYLHSWFVQKYPQSSYDYAKLNYANPSSRGS